MQGTNLNTIEMSTYLAGCEEALDAALDFVFAGELAAEAMERNALETGNRWAGQDAFKAGSQELERLIPRQAMASTVLQIAWHGLSRTYSHPRLAPPGRQIPALNSSLRDCIHFGRNQSMHWDEGSLRSPTREFFAVAVGANPALSGFETESKAVEMLRILDWRTLEFVSAELLGLRNES